MKNQSTMEVPELSCQSNLSNTYTAADFYNPQLPTTTDATWMYPKHKSLGDCIHLENALATYSNKFAGATNDNPNKECLKMSDQRVVQVFVLDPDKNVPLDKRLLYTGPQQFTDMSDQDLFFDLNIKDILVKHNEYRVTVVNKSKSSATEKVYLEEIRVSQLKMVVSVIAQF